MTGFRRLEAGRAAVVVVGRDRVERRPGGTANEPAARSADRVGTVAKHYDAEDHLIEEDFQSMPGFGAKFPQYWSLGYAYGPEGHPFEVGTTSHNSNYLTTDFQYDSVFWDDDAMLFSEDAQGNIDDVKIGTLADFQAHAGLASGQTGPLLSVIDRDMKGQTIGCHASDGTTSAASAYRPWLSSSGPICIASAGTIGRGGVLTMPRTDGLFDGWNTVQGVRSYDAQAGIWNTPDAYRGDVHDPMSQKPYMWNGNNPYEYSDPSGFCRDGRDASCLGGIDWGRLYSQFDAILNALTFIIPGGRFGRALDSGRAAGIAARIEVGSAKSLERLTIHIAERHTVGGAESIGTSLFNKGTSLGDIARYIKLTLANAKPQMQGTSAVYEYDLGHIIGTDSNGNATSMLRVVGDGHGNLLTAYPIPK